VARPVDDYLMPSVMPSESPSLAAGSAVSYLDGLRGHSPNWNLASSRRIAIMLAVSWPQGAVSSPWNGRGWNGSHLRPPEGRGLVRLGPPVRSFGDAPIASVTSASIKLLGPAAAPA
jgi:hypothetical protein